MNGLPTINPNSLGPKGEELPIREFEGVPDWNAEAWRQIQARDAEALKKQVSLAKSLAGYSMSALNSTYAVLNRTNQDLELRDAIALEIERRVDGTDTDAAMATSLM